MSLVTELLVNYLVPSLERQFIASEPALQEMLLKEAKILGEQLELWLASKVKSEV